MADVWCVEHREGTCAVKSGRKPSESADSVETKCGKFVILPFGYEKAEPTCEECASGDTGGEG